MLPGPRPGPEAQEGGARAAGEADAVPASRPRGPSSAPGLGRPFLSAEGRGLTQPVGTGASIHSTGSY